MAAAVDPRFSLAARVVKAAVVDVLKCPTARSTVGYSFGKANGLELKVITFSTEAPTDEQQAAILAKANAIVAEAVPVNTYQATRDALQAEIGAAAFNNGRMPGENGESVLTVMHIPGYTVSVCDEPVAANTRLVGAIEEAKPAKFNKKRKMLQLFLRVVTDEAVEAAAVEVAAAGPAAAKADVAPYDHAPPAKDKKKKAGAPAAAAAAAAAGGGGGKKDKKKDKPAAAAAAAAAVPAAAAEAEPAAAAAAAAAGEGQVITPWEIEAEDDKGVDYDKLIRDFGCSSITPSIISRVEALTGRKAHRFLRRGLFFSHRDLELLLDRYARGEPFYLYTGRGPSSEALHLGHLIPFHFTQYLQEAFGAALVIQLTDDEKFLFKPQLTVEQCKELAFANARDIIACGFNEQKTFMFIDTDYIQHMYPNILRIQKMITYNQARGCFGFDGASNIGKSAFPAVQAAPSFSSTFKVPLCGRDNMLCLIPQAIDQDPYFRMTRDVAPRLGLEKPALIHSKFFPSLRGAKSKMGASVEGSAIFVTDTPKQIKKKINKYALSGGQETRELQEELGADLDVDVAYQYLTFFLEDDEELERIGTEYKAGRMMTGQVKARLIEVLTEMVTEHQRRREAVTDEVVARFLAIRPLDLSLRAPTKEKAAAAE